MSRVPSCARYVLLLGSLLVPCVAAGSGNAVHKCRGADGRSYYQATACAPEQRTEWVRDYPAGPAATTATPASRPATREAETARRPVRSARTGPPRRQGAPRGAVISLHRDPSACERAKRARDQAYARLGLKRDFATSRKLDDRVNDACR